MKTPAEGLRDYNYPGIWGKTMKVTNEQLAELRAWFDDDTPEGPTAKGEQVRAVIDECIAARGESVSLITAERERMDKLVESLQRDLAEVVDALNLLVCECELPGEEWESKQALRVARAVLDAARKEQP